MSHLILSKSLIKKLSIFNKKHQIFIECLKKVNDSSIFIVRKILITIITSFIINAIISKDAIMHEENLKAL